MLSRRGEVPFVAIRVGRSNDPREVLALARELKVSRAEALGFVALWEELILEVGDANTGRVKGYDAVHVAAKLDWHGKPAALIEALKHAGLLASQRRVYVHPYWRQSITGSYAADRAEQREHWRQKKALQRAGDVSETSQGRPLSVPETSQGTADIEKERKEGQGADAPLAPPGRGGNLRWKWMLDNHERPINPQGCIRILHELSDEDWALVQWAIERFRGPGPLSSLGKKRAAAMDTHRFLVSGAYLQFRRERAEKLKPKPVKTSTFTQDLQRDNEERAKQAADFVLQQLADTADEEQRTKLKARWVKLHPDVAPPWGDSSTPPLQ